MKVIKPVLLLSLILGLTGRAADFDASTNTVGPVAGGIMTPVNQLVTPAGTLVDLPGMRPQALALSPDGRLLVTAGKTHELVVLDPVSGKILQRVALPSDKARATTAVSAQILSPDREAELSFTGLAFSPDGTRIYLANVNGDIKVFGVDPNQKISPLFSIGLPAANAPGRDEEIPAGIAISADGKRIYVAGNLSNTLLELDAGTGDVLRTWKTGVAPFDVVLAKSKIYVSNWGGRRPDADSLTGPAGQGTLVRVDVRSIASEGSVTSIDPAAGRQNEILTGQRTGALKLSPNGKFLVAANAGSDTLSVIDTRTDEIVETICARQNPGDLFGAQPNALAFDRTGKKLFACNGTQNAVAVFQFQPGASKLLGLIPAGWFPGAIAFDARRGKIDVANIKGLGPGSPDRDGRRRFISGHVAGSLSLIPVPTAKELARFTTQALADLRYPLLQQARLPARPGLAPVPVPERVGESSVFKHVIYIIKENRSYDQVLGDISAGNGDPNLCNFGQRVTPNQHKITHDFVLLDNTYCSGILSADGHNWADSAIANDYLERQFAGWPRSYPDGATADGEVDALAYSSAGFIWDDALQHGKTVRDYGEFATSRDRWTDRTRRGRPHFLDCYRDFMGGSNSLTIWSEPNVESLRSCLDTNCSGWDLNVPDVWRAAHFGQAIKEYEQRGDLPALVILYLPNDHTSGTGAGSPTPSARVADNDLAVGRVVEAVSHSKFWRDTCIFAVEDDPQAGWDHVSGYRTTAYVASAYTRRNAVVSTQYNQTSLLRTMELMLGLPPMNQMDATATPMFDCFTNTPDFTPFDAVANEVPLDQMNPAPKTISDSQLRQDALVSARLPLDQPDRCNEEVLNHILWRATMGNQPYPDWAVKVVDED